MATSVKQMMEAANAAVPKITPAQAREMIDKGNTLVVDVRDAPEVEKSGKIAGAVHVSRGMLEFRADPSRPTTTRISPRTRPSFCTAHPADARRWLPRYSRTWALAKCTTSAPSRIGSKAAARSKSRPGRAREKPAIDTQYAPPTMELTCSRQCSLAAPSASPQRRTLSR